jgi:hypothetical protein
MTPSDFPRSKYIAETKVISDLACGVLLLSTTEEAA